jgi:hypothetical protein
MDYLCLTTVFVKRASQISVYSRRVRCLALACLLLIACFSFAEATHLHTLASPGGERHCDFCLLVHANTAAAPVAAAVAVLNPVPTQIIHSEDCQVRTLLRGSDLYIRPPPLV